MAELVNSQEIVISYSSVDGGGLLHSETNYTECDFNSSSPTGVKFDQCNFNRCTFDTLFLDDNEFVNCVFTRCTFYKSIWSNVVFSGTWFVNCSFEDDYSMDDVTFYKCTFMQTSFKNKVKQTNSDTITFNSCNFLKIVFDDYCLNGTTIKKSILKRCEFLTCDIEYTIFENTSILRSIFDTLYISNSRWYNLRFTKCLWKNNSLYHNNNFDHVILVETEVENCEGDDDSLHSILVSPHCTGSEFNFSGPNSANWANGNDSATSKPSKPSPTQQYKKSKSPCLYISEGL